MKRTLSYLKPYSGRVAAELVFKAIGSAAELFLPLIMEYMIDDVVPTKDVGAFMLMGAAMLGFSFIALFGNIVANRMSATCAGGMTHDLRYALFERISYLKSAQVDRFTAPSLISRLTSDTYYVNQAVARTMRLGIRAPILLVGGLVFSFVLDWRLALVLAACVPFVVTAVVIITKKSVRMYAVVQANGDGAVRAMQENITGIRVVKALSRTDREIKKFDGINSALAENEFRSNRITSLTNPLATLILNIGLVFVILVGAYVGAQAGTVLAFLSYFTLILNAMLGISKIFVVLSRGIASGQRIEEVLATDPTMPVGDYPEGNSAYAIEFRGVSFSYNGTKDDVEDISFAVKKGQTVGVIGGTGSGKTTLINLLMRFYDVDKGAVYVDGRDVRTFEGDELRARFGVAFQSDFLIADTIRENIDYFRGIAEENLKGASESAVADEFIRAVEGGMDYRLAQKATNLSGGQKQRLLIARALAGNPEILVLDDSSSALDYATDAKLRKSLKERYSSCTKFIIAQRVSAVRHADLIIVMDDGRICGKGTHEELMAGYEEYRLISLAQMGGDL